MRPTERYRLAAHPPHPCPSNKHTRRGQETQDRTGPTPGVSEPAPPPEGAGLKMSYLAERVSIIPLRAATTRSYEVGRKVLYHNTQQAAFHSIHNTNVATKLRNSDEQQQRPQKKKKNSAGLRLGTFSTWGWRC